MNNSTIRYSNFELLRIISMAMIIGLHYFHGGMGGALSNIASKSFNGIMVHVLESLFIVGVNCFVLLTGYFQIRKKTIKLNKVINLIIQMLFYSIVLYAIAVYFGLNQLNVSEVLKVIFPFFYGRRWFIITYIILYLLSPFLNIGLAKMEKNTYQKLIVIMLLFFSVWPSFFSDAPVKDSGYGIINFILLYCIGAYLQKFFVTNESKWFFFGIYIVSALVTVPFSFFLASAWGYNFVLNIIGSIGLFLFFSKLDIYSAKINYISSFAFGVFLIHSDYSVYEVLFKGMLYTQDFWHSPFLIVHLFGSIVFIYVVATIIDIGRERMFDLIWKNIGGSLEKRFPFIWMDFPVRSDLVDTEE